jgi:hypothetical protein
MSIAYAHGFDNQTCPINMSCCQQQCWSISEEIKQEIVYGDCFVEEVELIHRGEYQEKWWKG